MKPWGRFLLLAACYLLSVYGLVSSLALAGMALIQPAPGAWVGGMILSAWACHLAMGIGWAIGRRGQRWVPLLGTLSGLGALLLWPLAQSPRQALTLQDMGGAAAIGALWTAPCIGLALYLVWFHGRGLPRGAVDAA